MNQSIVTTAYLLILISLGYFATDIYLPSLPALAEYFHASDQDVQKTLFYYMLSFAMGPLIFGPLSDQIGRKKVILFGVVTGMIATLGCLMAPSIEWLIACRVLQGIGCGAVLISSRASVSDLFTGKAFAQKISLITMFLPLSLSLAPIIGGLLQEWFQWQAVFVFLICYMLVILVSVLLRSESLVHPSPKKISSIFSTYREHLQHRSFVLYGLNFILPSIGLFAYLTMSPFLFQEVIGLSPSEYGSLSLYIGATIMATSFINGKLLNRISIDTILYLGAGLLILGGMLLLIFHLMGILTTWSLLLPTMLYFTCLSFCGGNSASKAFSVLHSHFGSATALLTTCQFLAGTLGSYIISKIGNQTALPLALCFIAVGCTSVFTLRAVSKREVTNLNRA